MTLKLKVGAETHEHVFTVENPIQSVSETVARKASTLFPNRFREV